ncbi:MAG: FAD-binding oxidoreductase [Gammaproteobacteria bacterium]|nr:FAD-binding oxidoreductase [Gammaproteobacteria bacterium]
MDRKEPVSDNSADQSEGGVESSRRHLLKSLGVAGLALPALSACTEPKPPEQPDPLDMGLEIDRGDSNYESWRTQLSWHGTASRRKPVKIVRPNRVEQVADAVRYARDEGLKISVKSGGHNYYESWMRNDALLVDMHDFRHVEVDPQSSSAWVGTSIWSYSLLMALKPHNLAFPISTCATLSMGGYIMGGGIGYGWQDWGMACHNVLAVEVVTADGEILIASADKHSDLFWAARGGIAGFPGIVTRWKLQCHPDPEAVRVTTKIFPLSQLDEVVGATQAIGQRQMGGVHLHAIVVPSPMVGAVFLPPEEAASLGLTDSHVCLIEGYVFADSQTAAAQITDDAFSDEVFGRSVATTTNEGKGLISVYQELKGREVTFVDQKCVPVWSDKPVESLNAVLETLLDSPANAAYLAFLINGRDMHRDGACHSMARAGSGSMSFYGVWFNDNEESTAAWASRMGDLLDPLAEGFYINEVDCFRHPEQVEKSYSADNWQRLKAVNTSHDPSGVFHTFPGFVRSQEPLPPEFTAANPLPPPL